MPLKLLLRENDTSLTLDLDTPLEAGRQREKDPAPYNLSPGTEPGRRRLVLASRDEKQNFSRDHLLLEPLRNGTVRVHNRSKADLRHDQGVIPKESAYELLPPFTLHMPPRTLTVTADPTDVNVGNSDVQGLDEMTVGPGSLSDLSARLRPMPTLPAAQLDQLVGWIQSTLGVLQSAVGTSDFLARAAEALVHIVGLHSGRVLLLHDDGSWKVVAQYPPAVSQRPWQPSQKVLRRVHQEKRTFFQHPRPDTLDDTGSLAGFQTLVAGPLLDRNGNVIGAIYGERRQDGLLPGRPQSGKLEAALVDVIACGVSTGLARQEQEKAALKAAALFEQFFTPELTRTLALHPNLLDGRAADQVTLLFCDVRGFSAASEKLGPADTFTWMNDVMDELSAAVRAQAGVLVDYIGDELMAMWGAPEEQPDQQRRAAAAGLAMLDALPALNERWQTRLEAPMNIGVGLNTGPAQVGNTGSKRFKFKYGPLGNTVNLASRVQGLTKYLRCRLLVSAATRQGLGEEFIARRVVRTRVVNIREPVELFEVDWARSPERKAFFAASEEALAALEEGRFADAARRAGGLLPDHPGDGPLQLILSRASQMLMAGGVGFDPVWEPPGK